MATMRVLYLLIMLSLTSLALAANVDVASVPQCAKDCLTSSSMSASGCSSLDVACLCNNSAFVSNLSCCVSTKCTLAEQAVAIQFNQQQCAAVNASAPNFVGCSPLSSTVSGSGTITSFTSTGTGKGISVVSTSAIADIESLPGTYTKSEVVTASFSGQPLFTGSCTMPFFALAGPTGSMTLFPEVGCGPDRADCCAVGDDTNAVVTKCPQDYFTTANGCCPRQASPVSLRELHLTVPSGYQVYSTRIGLETPCYSTLNAALNPATTPTNSKLTIVTDRVFSKKYALNTSASSSGLAPGAIAGIAVGGVVVFAAIVACIWWIRRSKRTKIHDMPTTSTFPLEEPVLPGTNDVSFPQELASPEMVGSHSSPNRQWPFMGSSPPAYENEKTRPIAAKVFAPQELPGSTYLHEHHPVFTESEMSTNTSPRTPTRSPMMSSTESPAVSPAPLSLGDRTTSPGGVISPLGSPDFRKRGTE